MKPQSILFHLVLFLAVTTFGCDSVNVTDSASDPDFSEDAATSIALQVSQDPGGLLDQVNDVLLLTSLETTGKTQSLERSFDPVTQTWTAVLDVERSDLESDQYASLYRVYEYQFQDINGNPRKFYATARDTAYQMVVDIIEGTGTHKGPYHEHQLTGIAGNWTVSGIDGDPVTVSGTYARSAIDDLTYRSGGERSLDNSLELTLTELVAPRPAHLLNTTNKLSEIVSGELSGIYHADITWIKDGDSATRTVDQTFSVVFSSGSATLTLNGNTFVIDPSSGSISG